MINITVHGKADFLSALELVESCEIWVVVFGDKELDLVGDEASQAWATLAESILTAKTCVRIVRNGKVAKVFSYA